MARKPLSVHSEVRFWRDTAARARFLGLPGEARPVHTAVLLGAMARVRFRDAGRWPEAAGESLGTVRPAPAARRRSLPKEED